MYLCKYIAIVAAFIIKVRAYEEQAHFCIETEPLLLNELSHNVIVPHIKDPSCHVTATTLTIKEKESFMDTMCKDHGVTHRDNYHYFKLHNGNLSGRGSYHEICKNNATSVLAWLPFKEMLENYAAELNPKERFTYIAKATNVEREKTELCHFRHMDLVNSLTDNLFTCIVMIFEDNFYGLEDNINVLVELKPLMYQIGNITYMPWRNLTNSYKTQLGKNVLKNPSSEKKPIYGSINYAFVEKLEVNTSAIFNEQSDLRELPLLFEHRGSVVELDANGVGGMDIHEKAFFGRTMDAKSEVQVQVIGQWVDLQREFSASLYEYYGKGIRRYKQEISKIQINIVRIDTTEPVFEAPESNNLAKASVFRNPLDKAAIQQHNANDSTKTEWDDDEEEESYGHPYPGFYPYFVASCLIVAIVLLLVIYGAVRSYSKKNKQEHNYQVTSTGP